MSIEGTKEFSAMQTTVGSTLSIAVDFIIQSKLIADTEFKGLMRPTDKNLYTFGIEELKKIGITSTETIKEIQEAKL